MNGDQKYQRRNDKGPRQRFPRMKRHCGPCGWRAAFVMHSVRRLEPERAMHQPVRPVKPGVVRKKVQKHRHRQIPKRKCANVAVNLGPTKIVPSPSDDAGRNSIYGGAGEAPSNFALNLLVEAIVEPGLAYFCCPRKCATHQHVARGDNRGHRRDRND